MADDKDGTGAGEATNLPPKRRAQSGDALAFALMLFYLLSTLTLALMAVVSAELQRKFGLSASQVGLLTSAFMFAYGAVGIPAGAQAARWGGRVLVVSCALFVAGSVTFALSSSPMRAFWRGASCRDWEAGWSCL
jgi:MFS family permease